MSMQLKAVVAEGKAPASMRLGKTARWLLSGAAVLGMTIAGIASCTPTSLVEQGIEDALPKYVGPAESYDVKIYGLKVSSGSASSVIAVGERVKPDGAPTIDRLALDLQGVVYSREQNKLSQVDSAKLTAVIKSYDLADFLESNRNVRSAEVILQSPNRATLRLQPNLGSFALPEGITIDVAGQLVGEGTQLRFEIDEVSAAGLDVSSMVAKRLSALVNPLADLEDLPVSVEITSVVVAGESIGLEVVGDPSSFSM